MTVFVFLFQQKPRQKTLCKTLQKETNWKCLVLTVSIVCCVSSICWCRLAVVTEVVVDFTHFPITSSREESRCSGGYVYIPAAFVLMLYLVYLVECWHCTARVRLSSPVDVRTVYDKVHHLRSSQPIVWWKAVCYHYVRRSRHLQRYRNGESYTTTQVYYERVNSHSSGSTFVFSRCGEQDISHDLIELEKFPLTRMRFSKGFAFANIDAANDFEEQRSRFFRENERYDDYMEMREGLDLHNVNFQENMVATRNPNKLPWYVSKVAFWVASFMLLSWPLRVVIEYNTAHVHYQVTKLFGINFMTPNSYRRIQTTDSCSEIEQLITNNNYTIVPSYSEALLLTDAVGGIGNGVNVQEGTDANGNIAPVHLPRSRIQRDTSIRSFTERLFHRGERNWRRRSLGVFGRSPGARLMTTSMSNGMLVHNAGWLVAATPGCRTVLIAQPNGNDESRPYAPSSSPLPPNYDEAVNTCRPLFMRRSATDRNIVARTAHLVRSTGDIKLVLPHVETAL